MIDRLLLDRIKNPEPARVRYAEVTGSSVPLSYFLEHAILRTHSKVGEISMIADDDRWVMIRASTFGSLGARVPVSLGFLENTFHAEVLNTQGPQRIVDIQSLNCFKNLKRALDWNYMDNQRYIEHLSTIGPAAATPIVLAGKNTGVLFVAREYGGSEYTDDECNYLHELSFLAATIISDVDLQKKTHVAVAQHSRRTKFPLAESIAALSKMFSKPLIMKKRMSAN